MLSKQPDRVVMLQRGRERGGKVGQGRGRLYMWDREGPVC